MVLMGTSNNQRIVGHLENSVFALGKPEHKKPHKGGFARVFE
jgi:hypothetical protein